MDHSGVLEYRSSPVQAVEIKRCNREVSIHNAPNLFDIALEKPPITDVR